MRRDGPRSISSGDLSDRESLPSARARNDHRRSDDISETLHEATIANADVAIIFVVDGRESKFDGVIEKILCVLGSEALLECTSCAVPFVRKIPRFFKTGDQDVGGDGSWTYHGLQIFLHAAFAIQRRQVFRSDCIYRGRNILGAYKTCKAQE